MPGPSSGHYDQAGAQHELAMMRGVRDFLREEGKREREQELAVIRGQAAVKEKKYKAKIEMCKVKWQAKIDRVAAKHKYERESQERMLEDFERKKEAVVGMGEAILYVFCRLLAGVLVVWVLMRITDSLFSTKKGLSC